MRIYPGGDTCILLDRLAEVLDSPCFEPSCTESKPGISNEERGFGISFHRMHVNPSLEVGNAIDQPVFPLTGFTIYPYAAPILIKVHFADIQ